jgi:hypothetical protein
VDLLSWTGSIVLVGLVELSVMVSVVVVSFGLGEVVDEDGGFVGKELSGDDVSGFVGKESSGDDVSGSSNSGVLTGSLWSMSLML